MRLFNKSTALAATLSLALTGTALAQGFRMQPPHEVTSPDYTTTFVHLSGGEPGLLYTPTHPSSKSSLAVFVMHANGDYLEFSACPELAKRGYTTLCANNTTDKGGNWDDGAIDQTLLEVKAGVSFLRAQPDIKKVVLWGHSGGATIMTAYQAIAEQGVKFCQDAGKLWKCPNSLAGLPKADGVLLADANWGQAEMSLFSVDPSVTDENNPRQRDESLDAFSPANGFDPKGAHYSDAFIKKFQTAEGAREDKLIKLAQDELAATQAGQGEFLDDEIFIAPGASYTANKLIPLDTHLLEHSHAAHDLVHKDGSITHQIIYSVRVPDHQMGGLQNGKSSSEFLGRGALRTTVKNFLSSYAIRTTADFGYGADNVITGVDWDSTYSSPPGNATGITVPFLALGMSGHYEGLAAETIYDRVKSTDKSIAFIEGALHGYTPCKECEKTPGEFGDTVKTTYDYADKWLSAPGRFF